MGKKSEILIGKRFGKLLVVDFAERPENQKYGTYYLCQCDCGNIKVIKNNNLNNGTTLSCGCYGKEQRRKAVFDDITGMKFGRLTVLEYAGNSHCFVHAIVVIKQL